MSTNFAIMQRLLDSVHALNTVHCSLDKESLLNYRPISHLSFLSKLTERVVKARLTNSGGARRDPDGRSRFPDGGAELTRSTMRPMRPHIG